MGFISDNNGDTYNRCHFWSNFEIGDLDFWRGEAYTKYFDFLDSKGGFYYEVRQTCTPSRTTSDILSCSAGETRPFTASALHCSPKRNRSTSSRILVRGFVSIRFTRN